MPVKEDLNFQLRWDDLNERYELSCSEYQDVSVHGQTIKECIYKIKLELAHLEENIYQNVYNLEVSTYEGDADNRMTKTIQCCREEDVLFYIDLLKEFTIEGRFSEENEDMDPVFEYINECLAKHPRVSDLIKQRWTFQSSDDDIWCTLTDTLLGYSSYCETGSNYLRYVDNINVYELESFPFNITDKYKDLIKL